MNARSLRLAGPLSGLLSGLLARLLMAGLLMAGLLTAGPAGAEAPPAPGVRAALGPPLTHAQAQIQAGRWADALASLDEAARVVPEPTSHERFVMARLRGVAALGAGQLDAAAQVWLPLQDDARLAPADRAAVVRQLAAGYYNAKRYPEAIAWTQRALAATPADAALQQMLAQAQYLGGDCLGARSALGTVMATAQAAGQTPSLATLQMLVSCQQRLKDRPGLLEALALQVTHHPSPAAWHDMLLQLRADDGLAARYNIDALRLQEATDTLDDAGDRVELAQLALEAGFPLEARQVLEAGFRAGQLGQGPEAAAHLKLRQQVERRIADDRRSPEVAPAPGLPAVARFNLGYQLALQGQTDRGLALMRQAIDQGGLKRPDEAWLRLGLASVRAGQAALAREALARVQGADGGAMLARLWLLPLRATPAS